ncbi:MAG: glycoside hydrolase family 43 protein [Bacteroidales bacterium]|nr:glycoside hydrolase family 43 protein [Bacteroidales bacterium]
MKRFLLFGFMVLVAGSVLYSQGTLPSNRNMPSSFSGMGANAFTAITDPDEPVTFNNPVIPGFFSDPSVCRAGEDYYLVNSTFEYFPGVPVFHSKDLVNWEMIGYCIDRPTQLPKGLNIYATTIRYHEGTFYMITTNLGVGGNFYVTATDPAGPWSDPIWIEAQGIDPDLFFDDDGKVYVISSTFELHEIDLKTGKFISEGRKVWNGTGGRYPEGPHIYKKDGFYYIMAAEGGTEEAHSETIARSKNIWGPYNPNPSNPILTHCNAAGQGNPIQGVGHADIINAHDGSWWIVFHGYRSVGGTHHTLGRETCLAPVTWPKNGWPVVNGNGTATVNMTCTTLPLKPFSAKPARIDFDSDKLGLEWNYIRYPVSGNYSLTSREGFLRLKGSEQTIEDRKSPVFTGRRVQDLYFTATTQVEFTPGKANEEAGMILLNNGSHFDILVKQSKGKRVVVGRLRFGSVIHESEEAVLKPGPVKLIIKGERSTFTFLYAQGNDAPKEIIKVMSRYLSSETVGGFTGVYVGLYATGNGKACTASADYDWFEYAINESRTENTGFPGF